MKQRQSDEAEQARKQKAINAARQKQAEEEEQAYLRSIQGQKVAPPSSSTSTFSSAPKANVRQLFFSISFILFIIYYLIGF